MASASGAAAPTSEAAAPASCRDAAISCPPAPAASAGTDTEVAVSVAVAGMHGAGPVAALTDDFADLLIPCQRLDGIETPSGLNQKDKIAWYAATLSRALKHSGDRGAQLTGCQSALKLTTNAINLGVFVALVRAFPVSPPVPPCLRPLHLHLGLILLAAAPVTAASPSLPAPPRATSLPALDARPVRSTPLGAPYSAVPTPLGLSAVVPTAVPTATSSHLPRPPLPGKFSGVADERTSVEFLLEVIFLLHLSGITMLGDEAKRYMSGRLRDLAPESTPGTMTSSEFGKILNAGYSSHSAESRIALPYLN